MQMNGPSRAARGVLVFTKGVLIFLQVSAAFLLSLYLLFKLGERDQMIGVLPVGIDPGAVLLISGESGFREGCGVAVFEMAPALRNQLRSNGLSWLAGRQQARGSERSYDRFGEWRAGPMQDELPGLYCAEVGDALQRRINRAVQSPGSFYSPKEEGALLLAPSEGLILFGYNG